jgi:hypothetical protein
MGQARNDASQRMQILRAYDRCFSDGSAKHPQAQTPPATSRQEETASVARQISKEAAATIRAPADPKIAPKPAAVEPYIICSSLATSDRQRQRAARESAEPQCFCRRDDAHRITCRPVFRRRRYSCGRRTPGSDIREEYLGVLAAPGVSKAKAVASSLRSTRE